MTGQRTPRREWLRRLRDEALSLRYEVSRWNVRGTVWVDRADRKLGDPYTRKREPHEYPETSVEALRASASHLRGMAWRLQDLADAMDARRAELEAAGARRSVDG